MITMRTEASKKELIKMCEWMQRKRNLKELTIIEIGSFLGDSTIIFADYFKSVIAIDPYISGIGDVTDRVNMNEIYDQFKKNISNYNNIYTIKDYSHNVSKRFSIIDCLYIDGLHTYEAVKQDLNDWANKVQYFLCGHDYSKKFQGVIKAVNEYKIPDIVFKDWSWVIEKGEISAI